MSERELPPEWLAAISSLRGERTFPRDLEALRDRAKAGLCPFCPAGPFKVVAGHAVRIHGIDRHELRDLLGFLKADTLTAPETHALNVAHGRKHYDPARLSGARSPGKPHTFTRAGRASQARRSAVARERDPERFREAHRRAARAAAVKRRLPDAVYQDAAKIYLEELATQPWGAYAEGARRLGLNVATFRRRLRVARERGLLAEGLDDGRAASRRGPRSEARRAAYFAAKPKREPVTREQWIRNVHLGRLSAERRHGFFCVVCWAWVCTIRSAPTQTTCSLPCRHARYSENGRRARAIGGGRKAKAGAEPVKHPPTPPTSSENGT